MSTSTEYMFLLLQLYFLIQYIIQWKPTRYFNKTLVNVFTLLKIINVVENNIQKEYFFHFCLFIYCSYLLIKDSPPSIFPVSPTCHFIHSTSVVSLQMKVVLPWISEMAHHQLGEIAVPAEEPSWAPSTHTEQLTNTCNSSSKRFACLLLASENTRTRVCHI